jgi:hypothetical protein
VAADPGGGQAVVVSSNMQAAAGTNAFSFGVTLGGATYRSVNAFLGYAGGGDAQFQVSKKVPVVYGFGYSESGSGQATAAFFGLGLGGRVGGGRGASNGLLVVPICPD